MFALGVRFLCDWAMGKRPDSHEHPEWPPHPDRVFMALAAAHFEMGGDRAQRLALEWLEALGSPDIYASGHQERTVVTSYVPVNDRSDPVKKGRALTAMGTMPIGRDRQARQFPVAIPDDPVVQLIWPGARLTDTHRQAINELCRHVTYIGHSSSLVQAWIIESPSRPNRVPGEHFTGEPMRVSYAGRLRDLEQQVSDVGHPSSYAWASYQMAEHVEAPKGVIPSVFDSQFIILTKTQGPSLGLESALQATEALRGAVLSHCAEPIPEWVSGHHENGAASERPHMAFVPLPYVGREHADGHLLGLGIVLPRGIPADDQRRCLGGLLFASRSVPRSLKLTFGRLGEWQIELEAGDDRPQALRPETWIGPATRWATVTPIVVDRHAKAKDQAAAALEVETTIAIACERIGLPRPERVAMSPVSMFVGVPHARRFPYMHRKSGGNRHHTHAIIEFADEVSGPILLGAGRYRGYGMCRPLREGGRP